MTNYSNSHFYTKKILDYLYSIFSVFLNYVQIYVKLQKESAIKKCT